MSKIRVLTVDDEPQVTKVFSLLLSRFGFEVRQVNDPRKAVAAALEFQPEIIFSDVDMPGMDGGELARQLQSNLPGRVPIVFVTSLVQSEEAGGGRQSLGGFPFLAKPINVQQVLQCIREKLSATDELTRAA